MSLVIGFWSSKRVISPLTELAHRMKGMAGSDKPVKLAPHFANDEVGQLAAVLDDYAEQMTALVKRDREFNSDVSHELRTPLAVIRGATELLLANPDLPEKTRQRLLRIERAAVQSTDLTTALLLLSRNERGTGHTPLLQAFATSWPTPAARSWAASPSKCWWKATPTRSPKRPKPCWRWPWAT